MEQHGSDEARGDEAVMPRPPTDVGTTPRDTTPRDRLAVWERDKGICQNCKRQLGPADKWVLEHIRALEKGGTNERSNLKVFCQPCAGTKTPCDHKETAKAKRQKSKSLGIRKPPTLKGPPMPKAPPQRRASTPIEKITLPRRPMFTEP